MGVDPRQLAHWLIRQRRVIEAAFAARATDGAPAAHAAEAEALRRFRSFAAAALVAGGRAQPALEGLRASELRTGRFLEAWIDAAVQVAGPAGPSVRAALEPLAERFREALRAAEPARRASGRPGSRRARAVSAAIDRVCDAFLAVDTRTGTIEDANPAAGALLSTTRDALLGTDAMRYVPEPARELWWTQLDAMSEGSEARRFRAPLRDVEGHEMVVEASVTRYTRRRRTLALFVARPTRLTPGSV